ncbi:MAG: hypothetical protein IIA77_02370 [Proteobacteria bacterium]|nr:hypothetical protein [Pseudomonadota bacterium]
MPMDCVDPLDKGAAIVGEARLAMNIDKLTDPDNISWIEYWIKAIDIFKNRCKYN